MFFFINPEGCKALGKMMYDYAEAKENKPNDGDWEDNLDFAIWFIVIMSAIGYCMFKLLF